MGATSQGLGNCVVREASEAFTLVRGQHEQLCGVCRQVLEDGAPWHRLRRRGRV